MVSITVIVAVSEFEFPEPSVAVRITKAVSRSAQSKVESFSESVTKLQLSFDPLLI